MSVPWRVLLALAVLLPVGGFAVGALTVTDDEPAPRETMVVRAQAEPGRGGDGGAAVSETGPDASVPGRGVAPSPGVRFVPEPGPATPSATPAPPPSSPVTDPEPVVPSPVDVDDDEDDDDDDGDDDDDDDDDD